MSRKFAKKIKYRKPQLKVPRAVCACFRANTNLNERALAFQQRRTTPPMTVEDAAEVTGCKLKCPDRKQSKTSDWTVLENIRSPRAKNAWMRLARLPHIGETVYHYHHNGTRAIVTPMTVTRVEPLGHNGKAGIAIGTTRDYDVLAEYDLSDLFPTEACN